MLYRQLISGAFIFLFTLVVSSLYSQEKEGIKVIAKYRKNEVLIRWAPTDPYVWQLGMKYGYVLERFNVLVNGKLDDQLAGKGKPLSSQPIMPFTKDAFQELIKKEPKAEIVQELMFGESFRSNGFHGSSRDILNQHQKLENRFGMTLLLCDMSTQLAISAGLMWIDRNVIPGTRYIYRVRIAQLPQHVEVEPGVSVFDAKEGKPLVTPEKLKGKFQDHQVTLSWPITLHRGIYTSYVIERSSDGKIFNPLNDIPYVNTSEKKNPEFSFYVDSLSENNVTYYYRIRGVTPFAETGPASSTISGAGHSSIDGAVIIDSTSVIENSRIFLRWKISEEGRPIIKGFFLERANKPDGPYKAIHADVLSSDKRNFVDQHPSTNNYYRLKYLGSNKDEIYYSLPVLAQTMDTIAPSAPVGILGKVDSLGVVTLTWKKNTEADMEGYRIFRANSLKEEFAERTNTLVKTLAYKDTININTLSKVVYYKVVAVDKYFNPSAYSAPIKIKRPDIIAPIAPVFIKSEVSMDGISTFWENSVSSDVQKYDLLRKERGKEDLKRISTWKASVNNIIAKDTTLEFHKFYKYVLRAIDSSGNTSQAISGEILYEPGIRKEITQIKSKTDKIKRLILLQWEYNNAEIDKWIVYRAIEGKPIKIFKTIPGVQLKFEDADVAINSNYIYKIRGILKNGASTEISKEIKVQF